jgi:glycosyltransferase involved in cell wall biosynthesis
MGVPCLGTNIVGIKDAIINNRTGLLFELGNIKDLEEKLELLIKNKNLRKYLSINAFNYVKKNYASNNFEKKLINFYSLMMSK